MSGDTRTYRLSIITRVLMFDGTLMFGFASLGSFIDGEQKSSLLCLFRLGLCQFLPLFHLGSTIERVNFNKSRDKRRRNAFQIDPAFMDSDIARKVFLVHAAKGTQKVA